MMKQCPDCKITKSYDDFWKQKGRYDGLQSYCKDCLYVKNLSNPNRSESQKRSHLKRHYGMPLEDYYSMLKQQGGHCATCSNSQYLCVDHDHATGAVRAILCNQCNSVLGMVNDDIPRLKRLIQYIEEYSEEL